VLDFVVCGHADYARFYLNPAAFPPPPTQVVLQQQYTSPLKPSSPDTFLGGFDGACYLRGTGYLGGDPNTSSKYHLLHLEKVCFAQREALLQWSEAEFSHASRQAGRQAGMSVNSGFYMHEVGSIAS
jgi:hypothetical protein